MTTLQTTNPAEAMRYCRDLTRRRAKNFYYGLKLLPEPQRSALYAVYAWMRRADDLADGPRRVDTELARARLEDFRRATTAVFDGGGIDDDPVLISLREVADRYPIRLEHFEAMLDGQLDDLIHRRYDTFDELREYCYRVASTVGLICITIWGYDDEHAAMLAVDRGIAFQLTNVLRDFVEDDDIGRVYLPAEDFARHGLDPAALRRWADEPRCRRFVLEQVERAESFYRRSQPLDDLIDRDCLPTLWAMTAIYRGLLAKMKRDPRQIVSGPRIRLTAAHKGLIALRARWRARAGARGGSGGR
ncbi:MAG: phytoene/squalene synthase family protein [Planctomycetota bacterium]|nr:phytoene/squalene synthase family protein [Planctomycetota bacterium]